MKPLNNGIIKLNLNMLSTYNTLLTKKTQLNSNTYLYHFDLLEPKEIKFRAGQYMILLIPLEKNSHTTLMRPHSSCMYGEMARRLYSIVSPDTIKNSIEFIIEIIPGGLASSYLSNLKVKDEVVFQGPAGMFGLKENNRPKIFLTTGTGIAPVRSMFISNIKNSFDSAQDKQKYYLFWGLKSFQDIYLFNDLKQWSNETMEQFEFKICLSREQNLDMIPENDKKYFALGHVDSCFGKQFDNETMKQLNNCDFYLCGRREVVESLRLFLINKGVLQENIVFEKF